MRDETTKQFRDSRYQLGFNNPFMTPSQVLRSPRSLGYWNTTHGRNRFRNHHEPPLLNTVASTHSSLHVPTVPHNGELGTSSSGRGECNIDGPGAQSLSRDRSGYTSRNLGNQPSSGKASTTDITRICERSSLENTAYKNTTPNESRLPAMPRQWILQRSLREAYR